jgi:hypothetical protein
MRDFTEKEIIDYLKNRGGWASDEDFNIHFLFEETEKYQRLHNLIKDMMDAKKIERSGSGYKVKGE